VSLRRDPLADPEPLIRRVYAYVAYRVGNGPDAEDITSDTFERALRYRKSYDSSKGEPISWLLGIARRCIDTAALERRPERQDPPDVPAVGDLEEQAVQRLTVAAAVSHLGARDRELIALRYGADLTARQIAKLLGGRTNTVEVALHRALARLEEVLAEEPSRSPGTRKGRGPHFGRERRHVPPERGGSDGILESES
jgi:RNA polymerase sigma factor (sigma-70 family)